MTIGGNITAVGVEVQSRLQDAADPRRGQTKMCTTNRRIALALNRIQADLSYIRGGEYERRCRFPAMYLAGERFRLESPDVALSQNDPMSPELHQAIRTALLAGLITQEQAMDLSHSDIIISGDDGRYAVIEVSVTSANGDIFRARARADALSAPTQGETFAAVASAMVRRPQVILADRLNLAILQVPFKQNSPARHRTVIRGRRY